MALDGKRLTLQSTNGVIDIRSYIGSKGRQAADPSHHKSHGNRASVRKSRGKSYGRWIVQGMIGLTLTVIILSVSVGFQWFHTGAILAGSSDPSRVKEIVVRQGDTLWSLAKEHGPQNRDVRETVDRIRSLNKLEDPIIRPGNKLVVPVL